MTEAEASSMRPGDVVLYRDEPCLVLRIHRRPVLVECQTLNREFPHWHLIRPGRCRKLKQ